MPFVSASFLKSLSQLSNVVAEAFPRGKQIDNNKRLTVMQRRNFIAVSIESGSSSTDTTPTHHTW